MSYDHHDVSGTGIYAGSIPGSGASVAFRPAVSSDQSPVSCKFQRSQRSGTFFCAKTSGEVEGSYGREAVIGKEKTTAFLKWLEER